MPEPAKRTWIIEPLGTDDAGRPIPDRGRLENVVSDLLGTLEQIGGVMRITADRVQVGELPPVRAGAQPEMIAETVGWIVQWQAFTPVMQESNTSRLMDIATGSEPEEVEVDPQDVEHEVDPKLAAELDEAEQDDGFGVEESDTTPATVG